MRVWVCRLQFLLVLDSAVILRSESRGTHDHILLSQIGDSHNLEGQVPLFISPRSTVAQLYPQALGYLFVPSYDSQGYGGIIRARLHTGLSDKTTIYDFILQRFKILNVANVTPTLLHPYPPYYMSVLSKTTTAVIYVP
jgi:hypothetical protein